MARTELPNGVILPAEYSDDWYEDITSNLTKLDDVIGSNSEKLNSNDVAFLRMSSAALTDGGTGNFSDLNSSNKLKTGDYVLDSGRKLYQIVSVDSTNERFTVGNSLFKVTAESDLAPVAESGDYDDLDNKPDLNPYDQHIANTDIHVTAADKNKWNNQTYVFRYSSTALTPSSTNSNTLLDNTDNLKVGDKVIDSSGVLFSITAIDTQNSTFTIGTALIDLAQDSDVMHLSGDESASGKKVFGDMATFRGSCLGNEPSASFRTCAEFLSRFDTKDKSGIFLTKFRSNSAQGALSGADSVFITLDVLENGERTNALLRFNLSAWNGNTPGTLSLYPKSGINSNLGLTANKWTKINGINPGALSLPDLNNGIDISGYFTTGSTSNTYTALADGYISILTTSSSNSVIYWSDSNGIIGDTAYSAVDIGGTNRVTNITFPVNKGVSYIIVFKLVNAVVSAKFFPCQGNV